MNLINEEDLSYVSGAGLKMSGEDYTSTNNYNYVVFTPQFDGSTPPELQARIDAGESFHSMRSDLLAYAHYTLIMKTIYPELYTG